MFENRVSTMGICVVSVAAFAAAAMAGPIWCEPPGPEEAGAFPSSASKTTGIGQSAAIVGELKGGASPLDASFAGENGDFQDMYLIRIINPDEFIASTSMQFPAAGATFDSQLFLFDFKGRAILASREVPNDPDGGATLRSRANDGTDARVDRPGLYYLAISGSDSAPISNTGLRIFNFEKPFEISGPDGLPAGEDRRIGSWSKPGEIGEYSIVLQGVSFAQSPCPGDCDNNFEVDFNDLVCMLFEFGSPSVEADCNVDGTVDFNDLVCAVFLFGPCDGTQ